MPAEILVLKTIVDLVASEAVLKGAKALWAKMPWAKDPAKVDAVERLIDSLVADTARLARALPSDSVAPELDRLVIRFRQDLEAMKIPVEEARLLEQSVRRQVQSTVVDPIEEFRAVQRRLDTLEAENETQSHQLGESVKRLARLEKTLDAIKTGCIVAGTLTLVSLILSILALRH